MNNNTTATATNTNTNTVLTGFVFERVWGHPIKARALCGDGKVRTVRLNKSPNNAFAIGGRVSIGGKTVSGVVYDDNGTLKFKPYQ